MKQSGRVSLVSLIALVCVVLAAGLLLFSKESLGSVGSRFMTALAKGDVDQLTKLSYLGKKTPDEMRKEWEFATTVPGKHYFFAWKVVADSQPDANSGSVRLSVMRNLDSGSSYEENFALPMVKENGEWKVDVAGINREMYPGLPR